MTSLEGKVIAITGAGSGIGKATAHLLAARGATISLADINKEPLDAVVADIQTINPKARIHHQSVNVTKPAEVNSWLDETIKAFGPLTSAANLAGVLGKSGQTEVKDLSDEDWDFVMNVNLRGVFNCLRAELQRMGEGGSIVSTSSVAGLKGLNKGAAYSTSKHAVIGLTRSVAHEEGHRNIRVNCIAPGPIDTPMLANAMGASTSSSPAIDGMKLAIDRRGTPEEVAKLIAFLLSDESTYTTGACYTIDGGYMA